MFGFAGILSIIFLLCLNCVEPRWRPLFKPKEPRTIKTFPSEIDREQLAQLKLPNKIFCAQMEKQTAGIYILMPWWYHYCQDLKEKRARSYKSVHEYYKPIYRSVLDQVQMHRRNGKTVSPRMNTMLIALQLTNILAKKKYRGGSSSSEESIENILYYKDCNHRRRNDEPMTLQQPIPPPKPQECKMCCSMCCGDNCINNHCTDQGSSRQGPMKERGSVGSVQKPMPRQPNGPMQPMRMRKKKFKQPLLPPIGSRRDFGFTRENIKNLISQDDDIKKILKDLVKVTMQKVDLVEMINARRNQIDGTENPQDNSNNDEE